MPTFEMICLANSLKHGGRCIAGVKTDGSGWLRLVSSQTDGTLHHRHYKLEGGREPELFSILKIECDRPDLCVHQPENWLISNSQWQFIGWPTIKQLNQLLKPAILQASHEPILLGNQNDRIALEILQDNPTSASLCLLRPKNLRWSIATLPTRRRCRAIFNIQDVRYNLDITDPDWKSLLEQLNDGEYSCEEAIEQLNLDNFDPDKFLLTISLSEPFRPTHDEPLSCLKLVAAVINAAYVKNFLKQARKNITVNSKVFEINRDLELSRNKIFLTVKPLIDRAVKTCWDCYPEERQSLPILRQTLQELLEQSLDNLKQEGDNADSSRNTSSDRLAKIKQKYPKAYAKWTIEDDRELCSLFGDGMSIQDLANYFQRQPGGIRSRLKKLNLVE